MGSMSLKSSRKCSHDKIRLAICDVMASSCTNVQLHVVTIDVELRKFKTHTRQWVAMLRLDLPYELMMSYLWDNLFIQFEKFKKTAEFNDTANNTHVKIETPGYYRVRFMINCLV